MEKQKQNERWTKSKEFVTFQMRLDVLSKLGNVAARFCFFSKTSQRWQKGIFKRNKKTTSQNLWSQLSVTKKKKEDFLHVNEKKLEAPKKLLKPVDQAWSRLVVKYKWVKQSSFQKKYFFGV